MNLNIKRRKYLNIIWLLLFAVLIGLSVQPYYTPSGNNHIDKVLHFIGYAAISFLPVIFFKARRKVYWSEAFIIFTAFATEGAQHFMPTRTASFGDLVANLIGVTAGIFIAYIFKKILIRT